VDFSLIDYLHSVPPDTALYAVVLAVIIAPWVYQWRNRVRRIMTRLAWIAVGVLIGHSL